MANPLVEPTSMVAAAAAPAPQTALTPPVVEPTGSAAPGQDVAAGSPAGKIPDEVLKLPAFQALFAGQPPALSATLKEFEKRPEAKLVIENREPLMQAGIGFYRSLGGDLGVVFNQFYLSPDEIKAADAAGQLQQIAPPFDVVSQEISKAGKNNPVFAAKTPATVKMPPVPMPPQSGSPLPASAQTSLTKARVKNTAPGSPTTGPKPGGGRLINQILKPVI